MRFVDWWKTSSVKAGEDYYKLRFDENEINDFRRGLLNASARAKCKQRLKRHYKIAGVLLGGCSALLLLLISPIVCVFGYNFYKSPPAHSGISRFLIAMIIFLVVSYTVIAAVLLRLKSKINADLKGNRVACEQGQLNIRVASRQKSLRIVYSINKIEFKVLEDAIGAEINQQLLKLFSVTGDSRTTDESYRFYYLPQSRLILHYEQI